MPKLAATLASLLLIASSIGVNIARYPQVGRTIDPSQAQASESSAPTFAASPAPIKEAVGAESATVKPAASAPSPVTSATPSKSDVAVPIIDVQPMVPAASLQPGGAASTGQREFRRLPPIGNSGLAIINADSSATDAATVYPTTSTP